MEDVDEERASKRVKLTNEDESSTLPQTFTTPISPPPLRTVKDADSKAKTLRVIRSPFRLTRIQDLPQSSNQDVVTLSDILGDPFISECWEFNYLHDLDFLMNAFDQEVRKIVKVHVVHGFWKQEDQSRVRLQVNISFHCFFATR
jgi:tyrosyl-DNA phosphodiesterase-1